MSDSGVDIRRLLGLNPSSPELANYISFLAAQKGATDKNALTPEVKSYPDAVYFTYYSLGLSVLFSPIEGYKPKTGLKRGDLDDDRLVSDSIEVYNTIDTQPPKFLLTAPGFSPFPLSPLTITLQSKPDDSDTTDSAPRPASFSIHPTTTGKDFVETLGEPDRKGGGAGNASGGIGIWCEWSKDGLMVEFGGEEARGPKAWETGKDARWRTVTVFRPKEA